VKQQLDSTDKKNSFDEWIFRDDVKKVLCKHHFKPLRKCPAASWKIFIIHLEKIKYGLCLGSRNPLTRPLTITLFFFLAAITPDPEPEKHCK